MLCICSFQVKHPLRITVRSVESSFLIPTPIRSNGVPFMNRFRPLSSNVALKGLIVMHFFFLLKSPIIVTFNVLGWELFANSQLFSKLIIR